MTRVYLDTSFVSACVSTRADPASIVRRESSIEWWNSQRHHHTVYISAEVINELDQKTFSAREAALTFIDDLEVVPTTDAVLGLAEILIEHKLMPAPIGGDAVHVAACCQHGIEYLLSWNVRHLANPNKTHHLRSICSRLGLIPPIIVTPDLLWSDQS